MRKNELLTLSEDILLRSCDFSEKRFQQIRPMPRGYYFNHHKSFIKSFAQRPNVRIKDMSTVMLMGQEQAFDRVLSLIIAERDTVARVSGKEPQKLLVFVADGETMERQYRSIGSSLPPYPYAISGALGCCLNADYIKESLSLSPAMERAVRHEVRHALWNLTLLENGQPTYQIDKDTTVYEALGGPLNLSEWGDIAIAENIDFTLLEQLAFWDWYKQNTAVLKHDEPYFLNPVTKSFYQWVLNQGNETYWYEKAKGIRKQS